jgi:hypothetical protein
MMVLGAAYPQDVAFSRDSNRGWTLQGADPIVRPRAASAAALWNYLLSGLRAENRFPLFLNPLQESGSFTC